MISMGYILDKLKCTRNYENLPCNDFKWLGQGEVAYQDLCNMG